MRRRYEDIQILAPFRLKCSNESQRLSISKTVVVGEMASSEPTQLHEWLDIAKFKGEENRDVGRCVTSDSWAKLGPLFKALGILLKV